MRSDFLLRQTKTGTAAFTKVFARVNKSILRDRILFQLQQELARQTNAAATSRDEAISEESRAENKWDTHSQEAAYLAEGQAKLAAEISANLELYAALPMPALSADDPIAVGTVVELGNAGNSAWYFIGPRAGGLEVTIEDRNVLVLTPQSPLGRQLIGKRAGEMVQTGARGSTMQRILSVH